MESGMLLGVIAAPLGNLGTFNIGARSIERVALSSDDLAKRLLRLATRHGDLGIRLEREARLRDGDVVYADDERVIAIEIVADEVLVFRPASIAQALEIAHALGNRHLPVQFDGDTLVARYDYLVEELFVERGVAYSREQRTLTSSFRHAHAPHSHE